MCALFLGQTACAVHAHCWNEASARYGVPVELLQAVARVESGFNPRALRLPYVAGNRDGSIDIGLMQINTTWLPTLERYGISRDDLYDPCTNLHVGAWILAHNIARHGWGWEAIGAYNAGCRRLSATACTAIRQRYNWRVWRAWPQSHSSSTMTVSQTKP